MGKQRETGGIENVDLGAAPLGEGEASGDGHLPGNFFLIVVSNRGSVIHAAQLGSGACGVQHGRSQGRLSRVGMAHDNKIADILAFVNLQDASFMWRTPASSPEVVI